MLIKKNLNLNIDETKMDGAGNFLLAKINLGEKKFTSWGNLRSKQKRSWLLQRVIGKH
jgi:hypothetical protein